MQIEKNNNDSYALTCCAKQLWTVRNALASYIYEASKDADEERGRFNTKLAYDMCNRITVYSDAHKLQGMGAHCQSCTALFNDEHPKCESRQHRDCREMDKSTIGESSKNENREE